MILADTSVWIDHFRRGDMALGALLQQGRIAIHPFVIGEIALGTLRDRKLILGLLSNLPGVEVALHAEVIAFIDERRLHGRGIGYVDVHLLAACRLSAVALWTRDRRLRATAEEMGIAAGAM